MQSCVIYNPKTGDVYNIIYNMDTVPEGLEDTAMILDIPNGCNLMALDVSEEPPKPVYNYWPAIDLETIKQSVKDVDKRVDDSYTIINSKAESSLVDTVVEELVNLTADVCNIEIGG